MNGAPDNRRRWKARLAGIGLGALVGGLVLAIIHLARTVALYLESAG